MRTDFRCQNAQGESYYTSLSLLHLMCTIACAHASTHAASSMCVKNSTCHLCLTIIVWNIGMNKMKER